MIRTLAVVFCLTVAALPVGAGEPARLAVYDLISERLGLMKPVAAWKHVNAVAVENLAREAVVLEKAEEDAATAGLDAGSVRLFFQAQIDAAKAIQRCWLQRWADGTATPPTQAPDLKKVVRPQLLEIGTALLGSIHRSLTKGTAFGPDSRHEFADGVTLDCLPPDARDAIHRGLGAIRLAR